MAYLVNTSRVSSISIGGTNYTDNFVSFQCADNTANRTGIITTKGNVTLGFKSGGLDISNYSRVLFKRGQTVIIDMKAPNGTTYRHPRGYLFIISTAYNPEDDQVVLEVGCRLSLSELTGNIESLLAFSDITIPEERQDFGNLSTYLAFTGQYIYQTNQNTIVKNQFFPSGLFSGGNILGSWASFLGVTTLSVAPLTGAGALPDTLQLNYTLPGDTSTTTGDITLDTTTSQYYIQFPMKTYTRILNGNFDSITGTTTSAISGVLTTDCGNTPDPPDGYSSGIEPCTESFELVDKAEYLSVTNTSTQTTYSLGPGGQTSRVEQEVYGPALEVNSQFYTDLYGYCVQSYSSTCTNFCKPEGGQTVLQGRSIVEYNYGEDGEVLSTTNSVYKHVGAAAIPSDWRSSYKDDETGETIEEWNGNYIKSLFTSDQQFLESLTITEYTYLDDGGSQEKVTTYTSIASRNAGISRGFTSLDAKVGIVTSQTRTSKILTANPGLPDRTNNVAAATTEGISTYLTFPIFTPDVYNSSISEAGPYTIIESIPVDLVDNTADEITNFVLDYGDYLVSWLKGEALGLRISEGLREDIVTNWVPGEPFWYHDPASGEILVLAADAASWVVDDTGSVVTFQGVWLGISNGIAVIPQNVQGGN